MRSYTAADFMEADLTVTAVMGARKVERRSWKRDQKKPRAYEGLALIVSGGIEYDFGTFRIRALPGQVVRLPSGIPYSGRKLDWESNQYYYIDFSVSDPAEYLNFPLPFAFTPGNGEGIRAAFEALVERWNSLSFCTRLDCKKMLTDLLSALTKDYAFHICRRDGQERVLRCCEYLRENAQRPDLRIAELSEKFFLSQTHLRRLFAAELGLSPSAYLAGLRLENARRLLLTRPDLSVQEIADACGYSSVYYFSSAFRKANGLSPGAFRKNSL